MIAVGTSGWQYRHWDGRFYPSALPQRGWLRHYAERFATVEVNNTFYQLPERNVFERWAAETPDDFVFALKVSRFLTHIKRLRDPREPIERFLERIEPLGGKLGPVLLQLPPTMQAAPERLDEVLGLWPSHVRVAVEFRHDSWYTQEVCDLLRRHGAALCLADRASRPVTPLWRTADWTYVRFHQGRARPAPCYGRTALRSWVGRLERLWGADVEGYAFFNNDPQGCAVRDARRFGLALRHEGIAHTRLPSSHETPVG